MSARGFTLIELIIAMALGAIIITSAAAALRLGSHSVMVADRLSRENALMRAGITEAHREVDFWTRYDDPDDAQRQRLRAVSPWASARGLPFTPLAANASGGQVWPRVVAAGEDARGWDQGEPWAAADPKTWWRGNAIERPDSDYLRMGRYAIFANRDASVDVDSRTLTTSTGETVPGYYGQVAVAHTWLHNQLDGCHRAIGFFAMLDYMPANVIYATYEPHHARTNLGGMPILWTHWDSAFVFRAWGRPLDIYGHNTSGDIHGIPAPRPDVTDGELWERTRHPQVFAGGDAHANLMKEIGNRAALTPLRPASWPDVTLTVSRHISHSRFVTLSRIVVTSPITGTSANLTFTSFGTSLRGARQQRHRDGGWARWDDVPGAASDPDLDTVGPPRAHP
ncbi:MAG TPA: prepilin-type N-terminal cleavage/methylation domain-containing protein [Planctomycetota bacterium]|nr:prepilin-type N-terminal cleavage/methylation domain-containing protein [Planctomycetota bacterium]